MRIAGLYIVVVLSWGFSWYAIELQLGDVPVESSIAWRFILASAILFSILHIRGDSCFARIRIHGWLFLLGLTLFCVNFLAVYAATQYVPSGLVSVFFAFSAILTSLNTWLFDGTRPTWNILIGSGIGITGLGFLSFANISVDASTQTAIGIALATIGAYSFSLGSIVSARLRQSISIGSATAWAMLYGGAITAALSFVRYGTLQVNMSAKFALSMIYLVVVGSIIGFLSYVTVVNRLGPGKASFVTVLFPVVAMTTSTVVGDILWSVQMVVGAILAIIGLVVSMWQQSTGGRSSCSNDKV